MTIRDVINSVRTATNDDKMFVENADITYNSTRYQSTAAAASGRYENYKIKHFKTEIKTLKPAHQ